MLENDKLFLIPHVSFFIYNVVMQYDIIVTDQNSAIEMLKSKGCCIYNKENIFISRDNGVYSELKLAYTVFNKLVQALIKSYDNTNDEFNINPDDYNITRLPRIGIYYFLDYITHLGRH